MSNFFNSIGLALTFSPNAIALLREANRLKNIFNSKLTLIIITEPDYGAEAKIKLLIEDAKINDDDNIKIVFGTGDPARQIISLSKKEKIDLLIAGALEQETVVKYYLGSVARSLMRNASSSLLILKDPSLAPKPFNSFFAKTDYSIESEKVIKILDEFAILENAAVIHIIRNYNIPALNSTILGTGSTIKIEKIKDEQQQEEEEKLKFFVKELNLKKIEVKTHCIFGKHGWETWNFVNSQNADILAFHAVKKHVYLFDKIFPNEQEYYYHKLPANLLIIR